MRKFQLYCFSLSFLSILHVCIQTCPTSNPVHNAKNQCPAHVLSPPLHSPFLRCQLYRRGCWRFHHGSRLSHVPQRLQCGYHLSACHTVLPKESLCRSSFPRQACEQYMETFIIENLQIPEHLLCNLELCASIMHQAHGNELLFLSEKEASEIKTEWGCYIACMK